MRFVDFKRRNLRFDPRGQLCFGVVGHVYSHLFELRAESLAPESIKKQRPIGAEAIGSMETLQALPINKSC
jgi:hypothetical protein